MVEKNFIGIKYILAQAVILILIVSIPLHFYIESELENSAFKDSAELQLYAQKVAYKIYRFSNSNDKEFYFPRSNTFKSAIYDKNGDEIFSLLEEKIELSNKNSFILNSKRFLKIKLKDNVFDARYLVVSKKITHAKMIQNVLAILIVIAFLVFLASFFIIKQSLEPYKKFNQYLENFIKDAMHELKTPIGVILLNLDGLDSIYENNKMIKRAKSALKNMVVVYEDLEFFVRKNRVEHPKESIDISKFTKERVEFFMDLLNSKEIKVIQNIEDDLEVNFSNLELSRIIDNTISNAIKYSKNKTKIEITLQKCDDKIMLKIKDEGKGIEDTNKIFDRYYRGDKISGGFGIGLSIVKNICDKNGVHVDVESSLSKGSVFTFSFISVL
ncbi:sensor histidine kinase [Sulfurospirillum sp. 1307]